MAIHISFLVFMREWSFLFGLVKGGGGVEYSCLSGIIHPRFGGGSGGFDGGEGLEKGEGRWKGW